MSKEANKHPRSQSALQSQSALEDVGSSELAEFVRDEMHDRVEALREKLVSAMDASARAASAEHRAMKVYLTSSRAWRRKAEELHTIADETTSPRAQDTFRFLARSYELLAEQVEASESKKSEKAGPTVG